MYAPGRLAELAEDIRTNGLLDPIVICNGLLLDGRNRLAACEVAGAEPRFEHFDGEPVAYVRSKNAMRRDLTDDQRRACLVDLEDLETDHRRRRDESETVADSKADRSVAADNVAKLMGESPRTSHKAVIVKKKAPELHAAVKAGKLTHNLASKMLDDPEDDRKQVIDLVDQGMKPVRAHRQVSHARLAKTSLDLPDGVYRVIYADPPWQYGDEKATESYARLSAKNHYPDMPTADICAMDVKGMAADHAVLFLWGTAPMLPDALEVIKAWGFTYKQHFVWYKGRRNLGHYHGCQHELLFIATRGTCKPETDDRPDSVQIVKRTDRHSAKPEHFRELIDELYPTGPRAELFRRGEAPGGWTTWGNEAEAAQ